MELLKQKILSEGRALSEHVLLVDSFLNHQVDVNLMKAIGEEFARRFADAGVTRIVTIEASGIAPAAMTALAMNVPMVIMKKTVSSILSEGIIQREVFSFTKKETSEIIVLQKYLPAGENVLIIDDFLANGEAALGLARIVEEAGSKVAGIGIAIEKAFQPGHQRIVDKGYHLEALASIASLDDGKITLVEK